MNNERCVHDPAGAVSSARQATGECGWNQPVLQSLISRTAEAKTQTARKMA